MHETKIGVIVKEDLKEWQALNVTAFLTAGVAAKNPDCIGQDYEDASGNKYLPIFSQPVFVFAATAEHLQRTRTRALSREIPMAIYTKEMFATNNDDDNHAVVKAVAADDLDIVGLAFRADCKTFDKIISGLKFHA